MDVAGDGEYSSPLELVESSNRDIVHVESNSQSEAPQNTESEPTGYGQRKRKKSSKVWEELEEHVVDGVIQGMKCKHCKMMFKINKTGTTTQYRRHLDICPKRVGFMSGQQRLNFQIQTPGTETGNTSGTGLKPWKYNQSRIRELMSHLVMGNELPFTFAEYEIFNLLMKEAVPEFVKVSRATLKADCITSYTSEKKRLMEFLNGVKRVSITTDIWRSGQKIEYMVVTCHFVRDWKIHKRVLSFCHIPPPHNGLSVCDVLNQCLGDWNLTNKLATITADNASYNDVAIRKLKDVLSYQKKLPFDGIFFHVRCCAHIINILVQDGLEEIEDIIGNVRETVKHIEKSSHRIKLFGDVVKSWHLPGKKLILDCLSFGCLFAGLFAYTY